MKKTKSAPHENHERWLVSYADFITLLFAFFVVMFATAQQDKSKAREVAESVREAIEHGQLSAALNSIVNRAKPPADSKWMKQEPRPKASHQQAPATRADLAKSLDALSKALEPELNSGKISLELDTRGLVISLREAAFFASGDDTISSTSYPIIDKIAQVVRPLTNPLRLEGYTDSVPIHNSRFRSNWELSTARSIAMLELLRERYQYPAERMSVAGFAENAPADTNDTEEGRAHNRRVDLVVLPAEVLASPPVSQVPQEK